MANDFPKPSTHRFRGLGWALLITGLFVIGSGVVFVLSDAEQKASQNQDIGLSPATVNYAAPSLTLSDLQGNSASLDSYLGKIVLVNNWATWCPPCRAEMPELQAYYQSHAEAGFVVVAIESGEPESTVKNFVQQNGITFPVWLDPKGKALEAFRNWSLPSTYIIDRDGVVRMSWTGQVNQATLEKYVTPLLEK